MRGVRLTQAGKGKFTGRLYLSPSEQLAITDAASNSALVEAVKASAQVDLPVNHLAERFEEMARRQGAILDAELRPAVIKLLAAELWVNHKALDAPAEKLISTTLHQGAIAPELIQEFSSEFPPSIIRFAMVDAAPASPREFLKRAGIEIKELAENPEFQKLADKRPSALLQAAIGRPSNAPSRLRELAGRIQNQSIKR